MLRRNQATPFQVEVKKAADKALGWADNPPVPVYLSEAKREFLATRGGLKALHRLEEVHLARVVNDLINEAMAASE